MKLATNHIKGRRILLAIFALSLVFLTSNKPCVAQAPSTANQLKAVFLFNFSQFVTWPSNSMADNSPFVIGVLGNDPFSSYIESVVEGEKVANHSIIIQRYDDVREMKNCQILFINKADAGEVAKSVGSRPILTVSDDEGFAKSGGMVQFYLASNKIKIRINLNAAKAANLQISSKLLRLAEVIE